MKNICPVIAGPTAVGKTGLTLSLAEQFPVEVISLDSRQIYKGMKIGTAQPSEKEQSVCKHHLIDFLSPDDTYSAQAFRNDFCNIHNDITERGKLPILVGGAGMYLTVLQNGLLEIPQDNSGKLREQLDNLSDSEIRTDLEKVDSDSFKRIHPNDRYRSQRALEIFKTTGKTMSQLISDQRPNPALSLEFPLLFLNRERSELHQRIAHRTELMLRSGWIEETSELLENHLTTSPGLRSIGYREISMFLNNELQKDSLSERIIEVTRQYAKRQITWFKAQPQFLSCSPENSISLSNFRKLIDSVLSEQS